MGPEVFPTSGLGGSPTNTGGGGDTQMTPDQVSSLRSQLEAFLQESVKSYLKRQSRTDPDASSKLRPAAPPAIGHQQSKRVTDASGNVVSVVELDPWGHETNQRRCL